MLRRLRTILWITALAATTASLSLLSAQNMTSNDDPLSYVFDGRRGQVEVGGRYVGMEFHHSRPAPSRISFYYPVANSIDLSTDYWKRDSSSPLAIGLRVGRNPVDWAHKESWSYVLSPHKVTFFKTTELLHWSISYEFCFNQPAAVVSIVVTNMGKSIVPVDVYTHLILSLRTCQTYARKDSSISTYDARTQAVTSTFNDKDADSASVFVQNVGESPVEWTSDAMKINATDDGGTSWQPSVSIPKEAGSALRKPGRGVAAFVYRKELRPSDSLKIVQIIGSCRGDEIAERIPFLHEHWREEIRNYDRYIREKGVGEVQFVTGDKEIDRSASWGRALIAANAHYINGHIVPMPCPAEYNFFFTHDLLLTNLGAVNFDLPRVKSNLLYVTSLAKDTVIPHAYYWRDGGYKTEYCEPENWNHLWFILVTGSYLRHSLDDSTGQVLYPFVRKSVHELLTRLHQDGLMYAYRPDWWDLGHVEGPRAYLTALTIRALREYLFISSFLHEQGEELTRYEDIADRMHRALVDGLWDAKDEYLTNYNASEKDYHFYAGSLIASVYNLLDEEHARKLELTARKQLVDDRIGLRIAMPPDFSTDSVIRKFKFAGDEAGPPYSYANGGVWPHGNAWYAMALKNAGKLNEAYDFARRTMTIDGVARSPNGLPAMYEYRSSDPHSPAFGTIDKPSFLWAGGMYLQVLYRLLAVDENEWNLAIAEELPSKCDSVSCSFTFGGLRQLTIHRSVKSCGTLKADGIAIPTRIVPLDLRSTRSWTSLQENERHPVLSKANAIVYSVVYEATRDQLDCVVSSFDGHKTGVSVESETAPKRVFVDGVSMDHFEVSANGSDNQLTTIEFSGSRNRQTIVFKF
jgi:hypothetical protein